jgi:hypothetical protein
VRITNIVGGIEQQLSAMASAIFTLKGSIPRYATRTLLECMLQSASAMTQMTAGGQDQALWQELQNKLEAFYLFEHVDTALNLPSAVPCSLPEALSRALNLDSYRSVWAMEGLGHYYADLALEQQTPLEELLQDHLPGRSMVPLHTGTGLSLAEFLLSRSPGCHEAIDSFLRICSAHSHDGYAGAAWETLGLVVRNLYPHLIGPTHQYLSHYGKRSLLYFWHGIGRAIYFSPSNLLPSNSAPWAGVQMCMEEPPGPRERRNALAGFVWALTLVNIRHPQVMAAFLHHHGRTAAEPEAFINGIYSSMLVWRDCTPEDAYIESFWRYRPPESDLLPDFWDYYIRKPFQQALRDYQGISNNRKIGTLFHF